LNLCYVALSKSSAGFKIPKVFQSKLITADTLASEANPSFDLHMTS